VTGERTAKATGGERDKPCQQTEGQPFSWRTLPAIGASRVPTGDGRTVPSVEPDRHNREPPQLPYITDLRDIRQHAGRRQTTSLVSMHDIAEAGP